jgi:threonyl-tRNA synthetase
VIIPISQAHEAYARTIANQWPDIRCVVDARNEKMGYRMREHMVQKVPYIVVVGDREVADQTAVLRHQNQQEVLDLPSLTQRLMTATAMPSIALPSPA